MENNEFIVSPELEQLRKEYSVLKEKFSRQEVINDRLIRDVMKQRVNRINKITLTSSLCGIFTIIVSPFAFHYNPIINASWVFVAATVLMMLVCIFFNWEYNHRLYDSNLSVCNLRKFAENVQYTRRKWHDWIKVAIPMCIVWFGWLCIEILARSSEKETAFYTIAGLIIGGIVGGIAGFRMNRKIIDNCDDILSQIEN